VQILVAHSGPGFLNPERAFDPFVHAQTSWGDSGAGSEPVRHDSARPQRAGFRSEPGTARGGDHPGAAGRVGYERAIQDFDEAIRLDPKNKTAFNNRGYVYAAKGQYRRAIQDYDEAIKLDPKLAIAFLNRGHASFYGLRFASAVTDLERYNEVDPSEAYTVLWLHLAKKHLGQEDSEDLKQSAAKVDQSKWPAPILRFYMGQIKAKQVLAAAASPDAEKQKGQLCEADFYTGEDALLHQRWFLPWRRTSGKARLRAARDACPRDYIEYVGAMVELKRISGATVPAD
jgi:lipoprotein NlpI